MGAQFVDLLWPLLLLMDIEHFRIAPGNTVVTPFDFYNYPISHSLIAAVGWSVVVGAAYFGLKRSTRGSFVVGACVLSHWILDFFTHRPDLPLSPWSSTYFGLGLWDSLTGTIIVEFGLFAAGVVIYLRSTSSNDRIGTNALLALVLLLVILYIVNLLGPPPPSEHMVAVAGNATWLFVLWAYWVDKHRSPRS
jgi:hypothetical protein